MGAAAVVTLVLCGCATLVSGQGGRFGGVGGTNINPILQNRRIVDAQVRCIQGVAPCDSLGNHLITTEILQSQTALGPQRRSTPGCFRVRHSQPVGSCRRLRPISKGFVIKTSWLVECFAN
ncbi:hypothetical protein J6590_002740 [Homalodisca vitripennis]|nr:hypothetical protein J6590_002740 [Homalodisca vitripennis]